MSNPYLGEITMFAGNFAPRGWSYCDGQLLAISQNDALFSLLGTIYGGDGRTTFGLPDLRGRVPFNWGSGPGLTTFNIGSKGGAEDVTLTVATIPNHTHALQVSSSGDAEAAPSDTVVLRTGGAEIFTSVNDSTPMRPVLTSSGGQSHTNMQPYLAINFIIAVVGTYPSRN